ncbi:von Willebrand factor type A domain-containing protein [Thermosynechococcus sp. NK55a]|jgi:Ca-activated chloride channel family protein|uniref:vWA domain-containing protein n=1 Tax=unclassified Thermosynechococcus TaxID=2622553 RepID=UPI0003D9609F|nr:MULTISPECIES: VWA domain-containing protein [unclassified Thermosynechococcus]AHB88796.1 von Willebrand factor type A domain-containing protein [Thermosynechococcus sp. NK55a]RMH66268.1 MAG: VWA domain-containing protein [Cyanobacteria bacterium J003]HIK24019.1 VWA domain-containing protein [Thermosynechococcus sp. M3746_W2019_013]
MTVELIAKLSDPIVSAGQGAQRQLELTLRAQRQQQRAPLNLCLILDHSGSMASQPLAMVKRAAESLVDRLLPSDRLSVIAFDHKAKVLVPNQTVWDKEAIKAQIATLEPGGGTAIDEGMKLGLKEIATGKQGTISQIFLLTDGENEHGDNQRCLELAKLAAEYNITLNALGFGVHWNQDVLEQIADAAGGRLVFIEYAEQAIACFQSLFSHISNVDYTNAHVLLTLSEAAQLGNFKPVHQVAPDTIELTYESPDPHEYVIRVGDVSATIRRTLLITLTTQPLPAGSHLIGFAQVRYDDPVQQSRGLFSERIPLTLTAEPEHVPQVDPEVQQSILILEKYRKTKLAETKLQSGDTAGAATFLQSAAKTALQLGDAEAAKVLEASAQELQQQSTLSESALKRTRIASKTVLSRPPSN